MTANRISVRCVRRALVKPGRIAEAGEVLAIDVALAVDLVDAGRFVLVNDADAAALEGERKRRVAALPRGREPRPATPWRRVA